MPWFKVDDSFYDHPKIFDAPDCVVALWVRAGSWSARNLQDGFVPSSLPARLCDDPETAVQGLLDRGLWRRAKGGYQFHDWSDYQPTREEALAAQSRKSAGGQLGNHRRWHVARGVVDPTCRYCAPSHSDRSTDRTDGGSDTGTDPCAIQYRSSVNPKVKIKDAGPETEKSQVDPSDPSDIRSVSDRSSDRYANPPVPSRPEGTRTDTGSRLSSRRNARATPDDDDDSIDHAIIGLIAELTSVTIDAGWAARVRERILHGHQIRSSRLAYITAAIRNDPAKFLPAGQAPPDVTRLRVVPARPDWCGTCDEQTRLLDVPGAPVARCPVCHPLAYQREIS